MAKVSILIPARNEVQEAQPGLTVLERTVQEVYAKAQGDFEVLVGFDGPPFQTLPERPNLQVFHWPKARGTKPCLNEMAQRAAGKYLFKLDAHCALSKGFDEALQANMQDNWVVAPRFYVLDTKWWDFVDRRFYDYFFLPCPLTDPKLYRFQAGGHWYERTRARLGVQPVDENMKLHGSSFFMSREFFIEKLGGLDAEHIDSASGEDIEISLKTWLGPWDGRVMVNKEVWIAHMHKGRGQPRPYRASQKAIDASYRFTAEYWMENRWQGRVRDLAWLVERFWPVPGWPEDWQALEAARQAGAEMRRAEAAQNTDGTLRHVLDKWQLDARGPLPIRIPTNRHTGLLELFRELGYKTGAEIGVEEGKYSEEICKAVPGVRLFCVDPWMAYSRGKDLYEQAKLDQRRETALARLAPYGCEIVRRPSMEAVKDFEPGSLDFVFIDGNHEFEYVVNDIIEWSKIVRPGGIVAGHDYIDAVSKVLPCHVIQAVDAYTEAYKIQPWFLLPRAKCPSWMWVKQ